MSATLTIRDGKEAGASTLAAAPGWQRNRLRYGFNEIGGCQGCAYSEKPGESHGRLKRMNTEIFPIFVFDKPVPNPFENWLHFAAVIDAVLASGAKPMITFAKFDPPHNDPVQIDRFVKRS